jgi:hypothetical protein
VHQLFFALFQTVQEPPWLRVAGVHLRTPLPWCVVPWRCVHGREPFLLVLYGLDDGLSQENIYKFGQLYPLKASGLRIRRMMLDLVHSYDGRTNAARPR